MPSKYDKMQDEKDITRDKRMDTVQIFTTLSFILVVVLVAIALMSWSGMLKDKYQEGMGKAEFICLMAGHADGVDHFNYEKDTGNFIFNCSIKNVTMKYDISENKGIIKWE